MNDTHAPFASADGLPQPSLPRHSSEAEIIKEAVEVHPPRLRNELEAASPEQTVALGNAALAVMTKLVSFESEGLPANLVADEKTYGQRFSVRVGRKPPHWALVAHPAAPAPYHAVHELWVGKQGA